MSRYIDADELVNFEVKCSDGKSYVLLPIEHLLEQPTTDVTKVVRCKDCIFCVDNQSCKRSYQGKFYTEIKPDDYCSHGERKDRI